MRSRLLIPVLATALLITGCTRIPPSFAGVKVDNWASDDKGSITSLGRGLAWYNPISEDIYVFPLHIQRVTYTDDQAIQVRAKGNATITLSVGHSYRFAEGKVSSILSKYRTDPETLATGVIRDAVRNSFVKAAAEYGPMEIMASKLSEMQDKALEDLKVRMLAEGIISEQLYVIGRPDVDDNIEKAISGTLQAIQDADREQENVRKQRAIADQKIESARGDAESTLLRAKAEAEAARLLAQEVTPLVIQNHAIAKWNGVLPTFSGGGAVPFVNVPTGK